MINPTTLLRQCLLAVALFGSAVAAIAGPTYHVSIDTTGLSGAGLVDFQLVAASSASPLNVAVSNFSSNFSGTVATPFDNFAVGPGGSLLLSNTGATDGAATEGVNLGMGNLMFDVAFSGAFLDGMGSEGSTFSFGLTDASGAFLGFGEFDLDASVAPTAISTMAAEIGVKFTPVQATAVPEPAALLLMLTGLGLVGFTTRGRRLPQA